MATCIYLLVEVGGMFALLPRRRPRDRVARDLATDPSPAWDHQRCDAWGEILVMRSLQPQHSQFSYLENHKLYFKIYITPISTSWEGWGGFHENLLQFNLSMSISSPLDSPSPNKQCSLLLWCRHWQPYLNCPLFNLQYAEQSNIAMMIV